MYPLKLLFKVFLAPNPVNRQSKINRLKDYIILHNKPELLLLHKEINKILDYSHSDWHEYDYGQSYYYQSYSEISISGLRNTESRIDEMNLKNLIKGKNVLEIGSNTGFITLSLANFAASITAIESNPFLVNISKHRAKYLKNKNISFIAKKFENYKTNKHFDVVLSLANHATIDNQTSHTLNEYFFKCSKLLSKDGIIIFESHPLRFENPSINNTLNEFSKFFHIKLQKHLQSGTILDKGRTMVVGNLRD